MKKFTLENVFKVVAVAVAVVFVYSNVSTGNDLSKNVYAEQGESTVVTESVATNSENVNTSDEGYEEIQGEIVDGVQVIEFDLQPYGYPTLNLKANTPTRLIINANENVLSSCNYRIISEDLGFQQELGVGQNVIEFTTGEANQYTYTCWMGMIGAYANVYDDIEPSAFYGENLSAGGCCAR